ncbi:MAG: hypothetical protein QW424_02170 [Candidatus Bathyarchaeia archaeon]
MMRVCEKCGRRVSRYICQECGRAVCEQCIDLHTWLCSDCHRKSGVEELPEEHEEMAPSFLTAMKVLFAGFIIVFIGVIILMIAALFSGFTGSSGIILLLGPIPIILGAGANVTLLLVVAAILTILCIAIFVIFGRRAIKL